MQVSNHQLPSSISSQSGIVRPGPIRGPVLSAQLLADRYLTLLTCFPACFKLREGTGASGILLLWCTHRGRTHSKLGGQQEWARGLPGHSLEHLSVSVWNSPIVVAVLLPNVGLYLRKIIHSFLLSRRYPNAALDNA